MVDNKIAYLVDAQGYKTGFFDFNYYKPELIDGQSFIYDCLKTAHSMIKPRWMGDHWEETATPEEIKEHESRLNSEI